ASPLAVDLRRVHRYGDPGSVDGPRSTSGRPREQATRRPLRAVITDRERPRGKWQRCRVGGVSPPTATRRSTSPSLIRGSWTIPLLRSAHPPLIKTTLYPTQAEALRFARY